MNINSKVNFRTSLTIQWLRLHTSNVVGAGSIPGRGVKMPHDSQQGPPPQKVNFSLKEDLGK